MNSLETGISEANGRNSVTDRWDEYVWFKGFKEGSQGFPTGSAVVAPGLVPLNKSRAAKGGGFCVGLLCTTLFAMR
jgi:hypothetical protein